MFIRVRLLRDGAGDAMLRRVLSAPTLPRLTGVCNAGRQRVSLFDRAELLANYGTGT